MPIGTHSGDVINWPVCVRKEEVWTHMLVCCAQTRWYVVACAVSSSMCVLVNSQLCVCLCLCVSWPNPSVDWQKRRHRMSAMNKHTRILNGVGMHTHTPTDSYTYVRLLNVSMLARWPTTYWLARRRRCFAKIIIAPLCDTTRPKIAAAANDEHI